MLGRIVKKVEASISCNIHHDRHFPFLRVQRNNLPHKISSHQEEDKEISEILPQHADFHLVRRGFFEKQN